MKPRAYMAWIGDAPAEGALLVFAESVRSAKRAAWGHPDLPYDIGDFIDCRVRWLRDWPHLFDLLEVGVPLPCVVSPPVCCRCELWGPSQDASGLCQRCREEEAI